MDWIIFISYNPLILPYASCRFCDFCTIYGFIKFILKSKDQEPLNPKDQHPLLTTQNPTISSNQ